MFAEKKLLFRIISVLKLNWDSSELKYARKRRFAMLSFRFSGDADFVRGEKFLNAKTHSLIFVPPMTDYYIRPKKSEKLIVVHFEILDSCPTSDIELFSPRAEEGIARLFNEMYESFEKKLLGYEYRLESLFSEILETLVIDTQRLQPRGGGYVNLLLDYIHKNFKNPHLTVDSLSRYIGVSTSYLRRIFKEQLKTTPHKYLEKLRMLYANELLSSGYYTVSYVAEKSGYLDVKYFSTRYKRLMGRTPVEDKKEK